MPVPMYDSLSSDYDRFVNWDNRLAYEMPTIKKQLSCLPAGNQPLRVLDVACGTGMHAIELARGGYLAVGADFSLGMIERARENALKAGQPVDFEVAGFGELAGRFKDFDALLCLGNSLPHVAGPAELDRALRDFAIALRPGGLLLLQNRNFDLVLEQQDRWMGPEFAQQDDAEWLFVRFYDFDPDGLINFNILTLTHQPGSPWQQKVDTTRLYPLRQGELINTMIGAGFGQIISFGSMSGEPFDLHASGNLVIIAKKI